jgi:hypothetical protein
MKVSVFLILFFIIINQNLSAQEKPQESERLVSIFSEIWNSAQKEFSAYLQPFPEKPSLEILGSDYGAHYKSSSQSINIPPEYLELDDTSLKSILAHELSHYFSDRFNLLSTSHLSQEGKVSVDSICEGYKNPLEEMSGDLMNITSKVDELQNRGLVIPLAQSEGISKYLQPFTFSNEIMLKMLNDLSEKSEICRTAKDQYIEINNILADCGPSLVGVDQCNFPKKTKKNIPGLLKSFEDTGRKCFLGHNTLLEKMIDESFLHPFTMLMGPLETKILSSIGTNPFDKLVALNIYNIMKLNVLTKRLKENKLSHFNHEDEADILAQVILKDLNYDALMRNRKVFKECNKIIKSGSSPSAGIIADPHHSSCWRKFRIEKLKEELKDPAKKDKLLQAVFDPSRAKSWGETFWVDGLSLPPPLPDGEGDLSMPPLPPLDELPPEL